MAWEENSCISLNMQLIAILSRIGVNDALLLVVVACDFTQNHAKLGRLLLELL